MIADDGTILGGIFGNVPGPVQEIGYAELFALVRVLSEKDFGDMVIITDCRNRVDDIERGKQWCLSEQS